MIRNLHDLMLSLSALAQGAGLEESDVLFGTGLGMPEPRRHRSFWLSMVDFTVEGATGDSVTFAVGIEFRVAYQPKPDEAWACLVNDTTPDVQALAMFVVNHEDFDPRQPIRTRTEEGNPDTDPFFVLVLTAHFVVCVSRHGS
jgi:hypothetical protein